MSYKEARRQAHRKALKLTGGLVRENPISEMDVKVAVDAIIDAAVKKMQETDVFLSQSDPMKVLPPGDDQVVGNKYGTCFMNAKTANKLMKTQEGWNKAISEVIRLIDEILDIEADRNARTALRMVRKGVKEVGGE